MKLTNLLSFYITFSILLSFQLDASGPSTVAQELAKQKNYASHLMVSINTGNDSGKQREALNILHQKILDFPIPTQEQLNARYQKDQEKIAASVIDRENKRMGLLPMNVDRMERNADIRDRDFRAESRGAGSSTPD